MPGNKEFQQIVASAPRQQLVSFTKINAVAVPSGQGETTLFYAPVGTIVKLIGMYFNVAGVAGSVAGNHDLYMSFDNPTIDMIRAQSKFSSPIFISANSMLNADVLKQPDTSAALIAALSNIYFDSVVPLRVSYINSGDNAQNGQREVRLWGVSITSA